MLVSTLALTSCRKDKDNDSDNNNAGNTDGDTNNDTSDSTYTVKVVDGDNNPVEGVGVMVNTGSFTTYTTDANGKVSFESTAATIQVMLVSVPTGYVLNDYSSASFTSGSKELTLTVDKEATPVTCTVTVKDQHGNPVANVEFQLCYGACVPGTTDANGQATFILSPGAEYQVQINSVPAGYSAPSGYLSETITGGATEAVVTITKN